MKLRDKHGRLIERGDVLKVFHFVGARKKRHYMYKQALELVQLGGAGNLYWKLSHLGLDGGYYTQRDDDRVLTDYEIVQSVDAEFERRPTLSDPQPALTHQGGK